MEFYYIDDDHNVKTINFVDEHNEEICRELLKDDVFCSSSLDELVFDYYQLLLISEDIDGNKWFEQNMWSIQQYVLVNGRYQKLVCECDG